MAAKIITRPVPVLAPSVVETLAEDEDTDDQAARIQLRLDQIAADRERAAREAREARVRHWMGLATATVALLASAFGVVSWWTKAVRADAEERANTGHRIQAVESAVKDLSTTLVRVEGKVDEALKR